MYELIYYSTAKEGLDDQDLKEILETARSFNPQHDITGCLVYHKGEFIQILEGEKQVVQALYASIQKDPRHYNVSLLAEGEKEQRHFQNWSMAFHELSNNEREAMSRELSIQNFIAFSNLVEKPTHAVSVFWYMGKLLLGGNGNSHSAQKAS